MIDGAYQNIALNPLPQIQWFDKEIRDIVDKTSHVLERTKKWIEKKTRGHTGPSSAKGTPGNEQSTSQGSNVSKVLVGASPTAQRANTQSRGDG